MTQNIPETQTNSQDNKQNDKELNFRALESKLQQERIARAESEKARMELEIKLKERAQQSHDDDDDDDPYVDRRKLEKKLARFGEQTKQQTHGEIQRAVQEAIYEERKQNWVKNNADFYDIMKHADKLYNADPELAETILEMPESFERQKLVYKNIKALGLHKPEEKKTSIQDKVDANRRSPYYQPSGIGSAPYQQVGDFTPTGQKAAYQKMKDLQKSLRI